MNTYHMFNINQKTALLQKEFNIKQYFRVKDKVESLCAELCDCGKPFPSDHNPHGPKCAFEVLFSRVLHMSDPPPKKRGRPKKNK